METKPLDCRCSSMVAKVVPDAVAKQSNGIAFTVRWPGHRSFIRRRRQRTGGRRTPGTNRQGAFGNPIPGFTGAAMPTKITMPSPPGLRRRSLIPEGFQLFVTHTFPAMSIWVVVARISGL